MTTGYKFDSSIHAHTLDGIPLVGTSSVLSVLNKPGLVYWSSGMAIKEFGCPDPKILTKLKNKKASKEEIGQLYDSAGKRLDEIRMMHLEQYVKLLDKAYRAHATNLKDTAEEGTDLHWHLSQFVRVRMGLEQETSNLSLRILPFIEWADQNVERFLWAECNCFSRKWHIGGISDCGFIDKQGRMGILDFKSSKQAYETAYWQCAAYDLQIFENGGFDADGNQTFDLSTVERAESKFSYYCVLPFGMEEPKVQENHDVEACKANFLHALALYRAIPHD